MKANGHKLDIRKYHLKIRRNFLIVKVVKPKNKLPKQMVDPPSLEALKTWPWDNSYSWPFLEQMFALENLQRFLLNSYLPSFTLIEKYCVEKVLEWFLNPWIQFCAWYYWVISVIRNISNDEPLPVIGCICKTQPLINSRNSLLISPCLQLRFVGCSLTELSTTQHSTYTSLLRQVWWKVGINNLSSFKNMQKYITENIKTSGERWYYYLMPCWWGLFW